MVRLSAVQEQTLLHAARSAYPHECCGLIIGHRQADGWVVDDIAASDNLSKTPEKAFEVDPRLRLQLQRDLRGSGQAIIGHYHSHPDGRAKPSETDRQMAWEEQMVWIIIAATPDKADMAAFEYDEGSESFLGHEMEVVA